MTARRGRCPGSGRRGLDGRFPQDSDRCSVCSRNSVRVTEGGVLAAHPAGKGPRRTEAERTWGA